MENTERDDRAPTTDRPGPDAGLASTRRRVLAAAGAVAVGPVAGCAAVFDDETPEDQEYDRLQQTAVYLDGGVELSLPGDVPTVRDASDADLVVLPGDPETGVERAVDWLADDRVLALLGDSAESTWLTWIQSDVYADAFDAEGFSDAEPDPDLLVAAAVGTRVTRYNRTWGDEPRDRDILRALDETLVDLETRTPRDSRSEDG